MTLNQGQRVRVRGNQSLGIIEKKLASLENVYIVTIDSNSSDEEKLVRGEDLEVFAEFA